MLLARATTREREISVRIAMGAGRGHIVRQMLVESALLAFGGLLLGTGFAYAGVAALARFMPLQGVPGEAELRVDGPILGFALVIAALATLGVGLLPARQSVRRDVMAGARNAAGVAPPVAARCKYAIASSSRRSRCPSYSFLERGC